MGSSRLLAGAARLNVVPPLGVDIAGFLRRWQPSDGYGQPLEANAVVLDADGDRAVILALDVPSTAEPYADRLRAAVAAAAECSPHSVLVNSSHTHSAPPTPGYVKTGGSTPYLRPEEDAHAEALIGLAASATRLALQRLEPAAIGQASDEFDGGVNRRQRTSDGRTIMGWNPDAPCDGEVAVLRIDALAGHPIATVVAYACHPTVLGPDLSLLCSDFVGPMRDLVRRTVGGECLFLQGCAGNIFPLEAVFDRPGPEVEFGHGLAVAALRARERAEPLEMVAEETPYRSSVDVAVWRRRPAAAQPPIAIAVRELAIVLPLMEPPALAEIRAIRADLAEQIERLHADGSPRHTWNPLVLHEAWAAEIEARVERGTVETETPLRVQLLTVGSTTIVAMGCEPFCEIGLQLKQRLGPGVIALGYSNGMTGYLPVAEEYALGGYEPTLAQRHFGKPAPFDPSAAGIVVDRVLEALEPAAVEA